MSWVITPSFYSFITDADAKDYLTRVHAAEGQTLEPAVCLAIEAFIVGCKADGIWSAIKASCILAGAWTLTGALVPLAGTAPTNNNFVSGDYNRKTGLYPGATNSAKFLNSNRNNNADPQNSQHLAVWVSSATTAGLGNYPVYIGASAQSEILRYANNGSLSARSRSSSDNIFDTTGSRTGLIGISRNSATEFFARSNSATQTLSRTSSSPTSGNVGVFARGPGGQEYSNGRLAFYSIGEDLDLAKLDTRVTALINAIAAAIP